MLTRCKCKSTNLLFILKEHLQLPRLPLLAHPQLFIHACEGLLICVLLIIERYIFISDCIEVNMSCKNQLVVFVHVLIDIFQFLLKLLNVFSGMRVHLFENCLRPLECGNLVLIPAARCLFKFNLGLDNVELLFQLV